MVVIDQGQCFMVIMLVGAVVGFRQGWGREVVTCAVILGSVLFLISGGENSLAHFVFVALPAALHGSHGTAADASANASQTAGLSALVLAIMTAVGYVLGNQYGEAPTLKRHRLSGMIPGMVNGAALVYFLSHTMHAGTQINLHSPSDSTASSYLVLAYMLGVIAVIIILTLTLAVKSKR